MKRFAFPKAVIATALIGACASAFAADTAQIVVKGKFVPSACSISITDDGIFDYETLTKQQFLLDHQNALEEPTILEEKIATFTVDCGNTDTSIAWRTFDALRSTATPAIPGFKILNQDINDQRKHGLDTVMVSGNPVEIGQYGAAIDNASVKITRGGTPNLQGEMVISGDEGSTWGHSTVINNYPFDLQSFSTVGAGVPQAVSRVTGTIHLAAALNRLDVLPDAFSFNGLTTLTLVYLDATHKPLP